MARKKAAAKKKNSKSPRRAKRIDPSSMTLINLKISRKDRSKLLVLARKHTEGNLSALIRRAALGYKPARTG